MTEEEIDISSIIETYMKARASEFSRFCQGLPHLVLTLFSTTEFRKRKFARYLASYKGKFTLMVIISLSLSFITGISTIGILKNSDPDIPILTLNIHSGVWDTIPPKQESTKEFIISNTHDKPITLILNDIQWNSISAQGNVNVEWDYDGSIIPPNQSIAIKITITNTDYENPTTVILDIIIFGIER